MAAGCCKTLPGNHQGQALETLIDEVIAWSRALVPLRAARAAA
jgi:hypothetical protein